MIIYYHFAIYGLNDESGCFRLQDIDSFTGQRQLRAYLS
jgi:hypothetical protein